MGTRLDGKTALVTGATSNIGRAIAMAFGPRVPTSSSADAVSNVARRSWSQIRDRGRPGGLRGGGPQRIAGRLT